MVNIMLARTIIGGIGNAISLGLFLSPLPTFIRIVKNKAVEGFKPDPYLAAIINCLFWVLYGTPFVHPGNILVVTINGVGFVIELVYLLIFLLYSNDNKQRKYVGGIILLEFVVFILVSGLVLGIVPSISKRSTIIGIICILFNILMYGSPLTVIRKVMRTKSVEFMPFWLSATGTLNGACWLVYGLLRFDINLVIPNGLGFFFGLVQLVIYAWFYEKTPSGDKKQAKLEVQLPENIV
ncbi:Bidirectional sugar transporter SWEET [Heracleum sosnowskyi]|uniref:Bidirectional sugar transporter SWEET n=1 Tax=Heracleum sosnowskyi TaxID=360622 RepID=A0AAD8IQP2_9APIA|nr:Bidirectional sugar transporter SWEET [Heracleum sosnowskyi]